MKYFDNLLNLIRLAKISPQDLLKELNIPYSTFHSWENNEAISDEDAKKLAEFFKTDEWCFHTGNISPSNCDRTDILRRYIDELEDGWSSRYNSNADYYKWRLSKEKRNSFILGFVLSTVLTLVIGSIVILI